MHGEVVTRLRRASTGPSPDFAGILVAPETTADIPDEETTRLVVLRPEYRHSGKDKDSTAARFVLDVLHHRGTAPRLRPNSLVALAPDEARWKDLETTVRTHLAWRSIAEDIATLDLTQQRAEQARKRTEETSRTIDDQVARTWMWGLHAVQDDPTQPLTVGQVKCDGSEKRLAVRTGARLVSADALRTQLAPAALHVDLSGSLRARWNTGHVSVGELWDYFTRHPYLVRLRDRRVLTGTAGRPARRGLICRLRRATGYDRTTGSSRAWLPLGT